ncbi:MAG: amidohydrolase family protein [Alphaproteobacteria bacterium]|nr:amidohydrolase family protein [Alphaproteobacteria bacterium]
MANLLFTNVRVFDGTGAYPFPGQVLIQGNRIKQVSEGARGLPVAGATVIDGGGATLMPGMTEAHTHLSWNNAASLDEIFRMPPEEHTLFAADSAKTYIDMGWTSCVGAAAAKPRLDVVIRDAINSGLIPGPRYLANSQEIATLGGLGDTAPPHVQVPELSFGWIVTGPEEMRHAIRMFIKYGVDLIKLNLSGEEMTGVGAEETPMDEAEIAMAVKEAKRRGKRVCAHARSAESIKQCIKHGIEIIYHASYADEESLDLLEANKDKHFVGPGLAWLVNTSRNAGPYGIAPDSELGMYYARELDAACESMNKMHKRGIKVLPGGDYGFAWTPHGTNAKDLEYFVDMVGMSPMETLVAATKYGGEIMGRPGELGLVKEGYLADLLLVDGDPVANIRILQDRERILAVMKDGTFYREPPVMSEQRRRIAV